MSFGRDSGALVEVRLPFSLSEGSFSLDISALVFGDRLIT